MVPVPKASINVKLNPAGLLANTQYNILNTAKGIEFKYQNKNYSYQNGNSTEDISADKMYQQFVNELHSRIFFTNLDGTSLAIKYSINNDHKSISFSYDTGKHYIDAVPFINPGVWFLGIGNGHAALDLLEEYLVQVD